MYSLTRLPMAAINTINRLLFMPGLLAAVIWTGTITGRTQPAPAPAAPADGRAC